jgi:hypothetical protein
MPGLEILPRAYDSKEAALARIREDLTALPHVQIP